MSLNAINKILTWFQWFVIGVCWAALILIAITSPIEYLCIGSILGGISYIGYLHDTDRKFVSNNNS